MSEQQVGGLRARYVARVGRDDVGQRVSVRWSTGDVTETSGARATDVVGRLLGYDDEALLLVDRDGQLHVIETARVLASRVVPPHPRLPAEPAGGTEDAPLEREAARLLLLDPDDRVLLVSHLPGDGRRVWTAPGGGLRPGEDHVAAARREALEELGLEVELGPWVFTRRVTFTFRGVWLDQSERWFLTRTAGYDAASAPLDDAGTDAARWWTLDELATTDELLAPGSLATHVERLLREGPPTEPVDVGR